MLAAQPHELEDPIGNFSRQLTDAVGPQIHAELLRSLTVKPELFAKIEKQIARQALEKAHEMFGPVLATLRAMPAGNNPLSQLNNYDFEPMAEVWQAYLDDRCQAIGEQVADAQRMLGANLIDVQVLDGDPHNRAHQPIKLTLDSAGVSGEFLFKSVDATAHQVLHKTGAIVTGRLGIENFVDEVLHSSRRSYIRAFTKMDKPVSTSEIQSYFFKFGVICSVSTWLEVTDLHFENIVTTRGGPKIIDVEFLLSHSQYQSSAWSYKTSGLFEPGTSPIAQKLVHDQIIPRLRLSDGNVFFDVDQPVTADAHILQGLSGKPLNATDYIEDIQKGAIAADEELRGCADRLVASLEATLSQPHTIRCWIRGTAFYKVIQLQLWFPFPQKLSDRVLVLREKLSSKRTISSKIRIEDRKMIIEAEINDLLSGNIPYFWIDGLTGDLVHRTGVIAKAFGASTFSSLRRRNSMWKGRVSPRKMDSIMRRMTGNLLM